MPNQGQSLPTDVTDRLNGWKDIAAFLGKGVRTVQRWEREYGLPVHRIGREGGEIVFASRREIDEWLRRAERNGHEGTGEQEAGDPQAAEDAGSGARAPDAVVRQVSRARSFKRLTPAGTGVLVVAVVVATLLVQRALDDPAAREPASWRIEPGLLKVFDAEGAALWERSISASVVALAYDPRYSNSGTIADLDGDGTREVVLGLRSATHAGPQGLVGFNADGTDRFRLELTDTVRFGETTYASPWIFYRLFVLPEPDGTPSLWAAFIHGLWFPSVLVELDASGVVKSRYWSDGYIESVSRARWENRDVVLVGATNNETRGASLAILDRAAVAGSAPATADGYRCHDCSSGSPLAFLAFPGRCLSRALMGQPTVEQAWIDADGRLHVLVADGGHNAPNSFMRPAGVWYELGSDLVPQRAEITPGFLAFHRQLRAAGQLDHDFGPDDERELFPVLRWNGSGYDELPPAPVER